MKKYNVVIQFVLIIIFSSCSLGAYMMKGDVSYKEGKRFVACKYYAKAYSLMNSKKYIEDKRFLAQKIGDTYLSLGDRNNAYIWYKKASFRAPDTSVVFQKLVNSAFLIGRQEVVEKYKKEKGIEPINILSDSIFKRYIITPFKEVNSPYDDYSPSFSGSDTTVMYFSSNRIVKGRSKSKDPVSGRNFSNLYKSVFTDEFTLRGKKEYYNMPQWTKPVKLSDSTVNSQYDDAVASVTNDETNMFITSTRLIGRRNEGAKIYHLQNLNGNWENVELLNIVPDSISIGHPAISPSGETLYFSARLEGGYGGADIWYVEKLGSAWSNPINMGEPVNTDGDEVFPYVSQENIFYFASNGHIGYGGLDIFKLENSFGKVDVQNLGQPINSIADDFGIVYIKGTDRGYFTSARGKKGDDIYKFEYDPIVFRVNIKIEDKRLRTPLENARVKIITEKGYEKECTTNANGEVELTWLDKVDAMFLISMEGYLNTKFSIDTRNIEDSREFSKKVMLDRMDLVIEIPNIFYDLGKWTLRAESEEALNQLFILLEDNPNVTIELSSNTDMIGDADANIILSEKRAQSVVDFLVSKGIEEDRLTPKGNGKNKPKKVSFEDVEAYSWLTEGEILSPTYINRLSSDRQEVANQLNRRTEFRVLRKDYISKRSKKTEIDK